MQLIEQIVPDSVCLKCDICCRFLDEKSAWRPAFTQEEKRQISAELKFDNTQRIKLIPYKKDLFICPCFCPKTNRCHIYSLRPLDCRLYPLLLLKKDQVLFLGIDKKCPYSKTLLEDSANKAYLKRIVKTLTSRDMIELLKNSPFLFAHYDDDALELEYLFDIK